MDEKLYNAMFGARVKHYREKLGKTQKELADELGYTTHATISRIEKGLQTIPLSKLPDFCLYLNCEPFDLLGLSDKDKQAWILAEKMFDDNRRADLEKFIDLYLKLLEK